MGSQIAPVTAEALTDFVGASKVAIAYDNTEEYTKGTRAKSAASSRPWRRGDGVSAARARSGGLLRPRQQARRRQARRDLRRRLPTGRRPNRPGDLPGLESHLLLDYGAYDTGYVEDAGDAARNCDVVGVPAPGDFAGSETFVSEYEDQFDEPPGTWSPYTYDSLNVLARAVEQAGGRRQGADCRAQRCQGLRGWTGSTTLVPGTGNREPATVTVDEVNDEGAFRVDPAWAMAVGAPY